MCLGAAHLDPRLGLLAWVGLALFAAALHRLERAGARLLAVFGTIWAALFLSQIWLCVSIGLYMGPVVGRPDVPLWMSALAWVAIACIPAAHTGLPVALGALLPRRLPPRLWLPVAWLLGERLKAELGFSMGDLLQSQWAIPGMLRSVALIGAPATQILAAYAAVAVADACAERRPRRLALALPVGLWFALLPPSPAHDEALRGVAAIHLADFESRPDPAGLAPDVSLVVWPEATIRGAFPTWEGPQSPPLAIDALAGWEGPRHVVNLRLRRPGQTMNAIGLTDGRGRVQQLRGKYSLVPWGERPYSGMDFLFSTDVVGELPALFTAGSLAIVPTICYEVYSRSLYLDGVQRGGVLLINVANDRAYGPTELGVRQAIGALALAAAETGRPAVRASISGRAAVISSTGAVLALSEPGTTGALRWGAAPARRAYATALLSDGALPDPFVCAEPGCLRLTSSASACPNASARTVVVSGHSLPPRYLDQPADALAASIACLSPELVVLDTCYGFSSPLLDALAARGLDTVVVGALHQVARRGLTYGSAFFQSEDPVTRANAVGADDETVVRWRVDPTELTEAHRATDTWSPDELTARIKRVHPNLVFAPLADSGAKVLMLVPPARFQRDTPQVTPSP